MGKTVMLLTILGSLIPYCAPQIIYGTYWFNDAQKAQIINIHNRLRALEPAANMQELVWDDRLAALAYGHVQTCNAWHRSAYERRGHGYSYIGENIWWSNEAYLRSNLQSAMLDFYNEKPFYDYRTTGCAMGAQCGHYTQYVWATTCAVGCAAVHCSGIRNGRGINQGHIIVCNYGEGGNRYGQRPYIAGPRCSMCPGGGGCTSTGLCRSQCYGQRFIENVYIPPPHPPPHKNWHLKGGVDKKEKNLQLYSYQCMDLDANCPAWGKAGYCERSRELMIRRCPVTCHACQPSTSIVNQARPCVDYNEYCTAWALRGECKGKYRPYMSAYCRRSCNFCIARSRQLVA